MAVSVGVEAAVWPGQQNQPLWVGAAAAVAVLGAGYLGIFPPDYVAATVAFAFGLAASSFFPAILLGIFSRRANREGVVAGVGASVVVVVAGTVVVVVVVAPVPPSPPTPPEPPIGGM